MSKTRTTSSFRRRSWSKQWLISFWKLVWLSSVFSLMNSWKFHRLHRISWCWLILRQKRWTKSPKIKFYCCKIWSRKQQPKICLVTRSKNRNLEKISKQESQRKESQRRPKSATTIWTPTSNLIWDKWASLLLKSHNSKENISIITSSMPNAKRLW